MGCGLAALNAPLLEAPGPRAGWGASPTRASHLHTRLPFPGRGSTLGQLLAPTPAPSTRPGLSRDSGNTRRMISRNSASAGHGGHSGGVSERAPHPGPPSRLLRFSHTCPGHCPLTPSVDAFLFASSMRFLSEKWQRQPSCGPATCQCPHIPDVTETGRGPGHCRLTRTIPKALSGSSVGGEGAGTGGGNSQNVRVSLGAAGLGPAASAGPVLSEYNL